MAEESSEDMVLSLLRRLDKSVDAEFIISELPQLDMTELANVINILASKNYIELFQTDKGLVEYKARTESESLLLSKLDNDEKLVYQFIKASGDKGIWTRDLKFKTNLHQNVVTKILKSLENKKIIKAVKSVKNATRKVYMLFDIAPSRDVTGGPWFTDSELDTEFVNSLMLACYRFICSKTMPKNRNDLHLISRNFPTAQDVLKFIKDGGITNIELSESDVSCLLQTLIYDGKILKITNFYSDQDMYRAANVEVTRNAFTNTPCGVCPVFEYCSDSGPITPLKCEYLSNWLDF